MNSQKPFGEKNNKECRLKKGGKLSISTEKSLTRGIRCLAGELQIRLF